MKKSEFKFIVGILIFLFGLTNIIPSEISVYDQQVIPFIEQNTHPTDVFYPHITVLIIIFRILIVVATILDIVVVLSYGRRYNVFGLRDALSE